uniref:Glycosyl transferase CAP10 domain-containing protein n=1 Tax=Araucaria cunninghamii TaxID=56994 RepID=A0A0D6QUZ5_ARACU
MKRFRVGSISCLLVLVFLVTFCFLFKRWSDELWAEQSIAASNLFRPKAYTEATLWERITKARDIVGCSPRTVCSTSSFSSWFPKNKERSYNSGDAESCPFYFKFIREDLKPWAESGITREAMEIAKTKASFRVMIVDGRLFMESYHHCFQTRDLFTVWGLVQLLQFYPGMVPDLDLMFYCGDRTVVRKDQHKNHNKPPPPVFHYCGSTHSYDIPFPDWSFWGWPEIKIPPWEGLVQDIRKGSQRVKWKDRDSKAYWKGNPWVSPKRKELMKCSKTPGWNAQLYAQDWAKESKKGFRDSKLSDQCNHRYKIYTEGIAWSVSLKYIMACDSPTLLITPEYHDFFLRGLLPRQHYWPITPAKKCQSIKFAVNWGNAHPEESMWIGREGSDFIWNELKMKYVYDYMLHALTEYSKRLKYKPTVTEKAAQYCSETILCIANEAEKVYMRESMVKGSNPSNPCRLDDAIADVKAVRNFTVEKEKCMSDVRRKEEAP